MITVTIQAGQRDYSDERLGDIHERVNAIGGVIGSTTHRPGYGITFEISDSGGNLSWESSCEIQRAIYGKQKTKRGNR